MIDPSIIEEAYTELNEVKEIKSKSIKEEKLIYKPRKIQESEAYQQFLIENPVYMSKDDIEVERDPVIERMRKLINDIQSMLFKLDDNVYDKEAGKEDDDIRDEMKAAMKTSILKMIERLEEVAKKEWKEEAEEEAEEEVEEEAEEEAEEEVEEEEEDEKEEEKEEEEVKEDGPEILKLFPTESVTSPQGINYTIIEINENKALLQDPHGEQFKIETNTLKKWKSNK